MVPRNGLGCARSGNPQVFLPPLPVVSGTVFAWFDDFRYRLDTVRLRELARWNLDAYI
jgi:hypothetical protein